MVVGLAECPLVVYFFPELIVIKSRQQLTPAHLETLDL